MRRFAVAAVALVQVVALTSCGPGVLVHFSTELFADGSIGRRVEVTGFPSEKPEDDGSRVEDFVVAARPQQWQRVHSVERPRQSALLLEGTFRDAASVPPALAHRTVLGIREDRDDLTVGAEDLVIVKLWSLTETYADPYGQAEYEAAIDRLVEALWNRLQDEVRKEFGADMDTARAERLVRSELGAFLLRNGRVLVTALSKPGETPGEQDATARRLAALGLAASPVRGTGFADAQLGQLVLAARDAFAAALSTPERSVHPEELRFWPTTLDSNESPLSIDPEGSDTYSAAVLGFAEVAQGHFASAAHRYRFHVRVDMPGRLVATNGMADGRGAVWFFRSDQVAASPCLITAKSAVLDDEALRRLGARRSFDLGPLLEIIDLLGRSDVEGGLKALVRDAVEHHDLAPLRDPKRGGVAGRELADLLDPSVGR